MTHCLRFNASLDDGSCLGVVAHPAGDVEGVALADDVAVVTIWLGGGRGMDSLS